LKFINFILKEWLLTISIFLLIITSFYLHHIPKYNFEGIKPIFLLFSLFVATKGIENSYLFQYIAKHIENRNFITQKLLLFSFFTSLIFSIDVSLVVTLPILFAMRIKNKINLSILIAMTAHIGAALTPFGTPQNLFLFSFYNLNVLDFIKVIAPFSIVMLLIFFISSFFIKIEIFKYENNELEKINWKMAISYILLFIITIMVLFEILPIYIALLPTLFALIFDRKSLKIDYLLILVFLLFIGLSQNIAKIITIYITHPTHIFLLTAGLSQIISNVPATLLIERFTNEWKAILWGSNVGSFGSPIAAMANLIAYRLFVDYETKNSANKYLLKFTIFNIIILFVGIGLYFII